MIMELSTWPLSVAEAAFYFIAANYLSVRLQTVLSLSASCRATIGPLTPPVYLSTNAGVHQ